MTLRALQLNIHGFRTNGPTLKLNCHTQSPIDVYFLQECFRKSSSFDDSTCLLPAPFLSFFGGTGRACLAVRESISPSSFSSLSTPDSFQNFGFETCLGEDPQGKPTPSFTLFFLSLSESRFIRSLVVPKRSRISIYVHTRYHHRG